MKKTYIDQGAEAQIYQQGNKILKKRVPKTYRHPELDHKIRKTRTKKEAKITSEARKAGIPTPIILDIKKYTITFEYINGEKLKNIYNNLTPSQYRQIGENIGKLHKAGLVHGDLTTSNMIKHKNTIYLIDFGLAEYDKHIESRGVDLHILLQSIKATHKPNNSIKQIKNGYKNTFPKHKKTFKRLNEIQKRGRYTQ
ncbi:tRNA A-37 threonylcarbamoyl transferase component Bud32 [Methanonatronarchaeum thermophilum]|uniref:non-specific serine/threonine protein kinase n=1 Tax=Methanonatronarchaeum thermophilum TaxID=1927129 RepID=A0A1Y3GGS1_9EURY|nr:Kae1-associated kinase Bud32 [Methanonatronarchaeum thermophilum]OUJ18635.1 tRNA A-37 threonylcarbamoyl transferase component Bud32 [Methanonatronarchaeum thermophilum]